MSGNGNGFRKWAATVGGSLVVFLAGAALQQSCATRDQVRDIASALAVPEGAAGIVKLGDRVTVTEGEVKRLSERLDDFMAPGGRFTPAQAERMEDRFLREVERCCAR